MFNQYGQYVPDMPFSQRPSPIGAFPQKYEIIHVNGKAGAEALQMAANSNAIVMDDTAPLVWLCQTDGAGYKTATPYTISPYHEKPPVDVQALDERISKLEAILNGKPDDADAKQI